MPITSSLEMLLLTADNCYNLHWCEAGLSASKIMSQRFIFSCHFSLSVDEFSLSPPTWTSDISFCIKSYTN